jgi:hypothetical protein
LDDFACDPEAIKVYCSKPVSKCATNHPSFPEKLMASISIWNDYLTKLKDPTLWKMYLVFLDTTEKSCEEINLKKFCKLMISKAVDNVKELGMTSAEFYVYWYGIDREIEILEEGLKLHNNEILWEEYVNSKSDEATFKTAIAKCADKFRIRQLYLDYALQNFKAKKVKKLFEVSD